MREAWIDAAKGILILLVVLGHAYGTGSHLGTDVATNVICSKIYKVIYMFHMPAFFVLAGVTWSAGKDGFVAYLKKKARRLLIPYLIWGLSSIAAGLAIGGFVGSIGHDDYYTSDMVGGLLSELKIFFVGGGCTINSPLWFLPYLFVVEVLYYWLMRLDDLLWWRWVLPVLMLVASGYHEWLLMPDQVARVLIFTMYLHLGRMMVGKKRLPSLASASAGMRALACSTIALYFVICWMLPWEAECNGFAPFVAYRTIALVGAVLVFVVCQSFPLKMFCVLGTASIGILVLHKFPLAALQLKLSPFLGVPYGTFLLPVALLQAIVVLLICTIFAMQIREAFPILLGEKQ